LVDVHLLEWPLKLLGNAFLELGHHDVLVGHHESFGPVFQVVVISVLHLCAVLGEDDVPRIVVNQYVLQEQDASISELLVQ
jgi:hypothetical protein